jgi:UDP-glucose 4-epimerase
MPRHFLITGSAGFIGSHLADRLLSEGHLVTGIDNLVRGSRLNLVDANPNPRFRFVEADVADPDALRGALGEIARLAPIDCVWHLAANSDIGAGVANSSVDLRDTFLTTFHTLAIMREFQIPRIAFASTSAVYGNYPGLLTEDAGPMFPISNYGAMKLASEASISAAVESFLEQAWIFRFPNVIGPRATHGIIYDLLHKLAENPPDLEVLGDGSQQKPYLHVSELIDAMCFIFGHAGERLNYFNIGVTDEGATVKFIAESVQRHAAPAIPIRFTGGNRGWVGDVPRFQYSVAKLAALGWQPRLGSTGAVDRSVVEILREIPIPCKL